MAPHLRAAEGLVRQWPVPRDKTELRQFLGLCSFYRKFLHRFADLASPLHDLIKDESVFCEARATEEQRNATWGPAQQQAFEGLRTALQAREKRERKRGERKREREREKERERERESERERERESERERERARESERESESERERE